MRNIIAIGGGSVGDGETLAIDRIFVERAGKPNPRVLFIPTASSDDQDYVSEFDRVYRDRLRCEVEPLYLLTEGYDLSRISQADLIYVGGGNTKMMLEVWERTGAAELIREFVASGKPVGGLSAGAICWFKVGNSDWPKYEGVPGVNTDRLDGLNLVDLALCPHTKDEGFRLGEFRAMMEKEGGVGLGLDDGCAIEIKGDKFRILGSLPDSFAHRIEWVDGKLTEKILDPHKDFRPLESL